MLSVEFSQPMKCIVIFDLKTKRPQSKFLIHKDQFNLFAGIFAARHNYLIISNYHYITIFIHFVEKCLLKLLRIKNHMIFSNSVRFWRISNCAFCELSMDFALGRKQNKTAFKSG